jgi:mannose-1-phosphate guanylyltransferase
MAGGKGERLWPLVRAAWPKVCLSPDGRRSLLQATIDRLRAAWPKAQWLIVTTRGQAGPVRRALAPSMRRALLVEPQGKSTAACITLAAAALAVRDPRRVMVVVPADHWIGDGAAYRAAVRAAIRAAVTHDAITTIGIQPTHPHPGLGYLCTGLAVARSGGPRVFRLARFVEKPSPAVARRLLRRARTYWNSGTFVGTADRFLECVTEWLPDHARRLVPLGSLLRRAGGAQTAAFARRAGAAYGAVQAISFDHGVMDHLRSGLVVEGRFAWADLGSWDTWARLGRSQVRLLEVESGNIRAIGRPNHLIAAIGVRDLLIVQTPTATLVCHPEQAQAVRAVVQRIASDPRLAAYR